MVSGTHVYRAHRITTVSDTIAVRPARPGADPRHPAHGPVREDSGLSDQSSAIEELQDPTTGATRLMELAQAHPELAREISAHPNAYEGLKDWLRQYGTFSAPEVDVATRLRPSRTAEPTVTAPDPATASEPASSAAAVSASPEPEPEPTPTPTPTYSAMPEPTPYQPTPYQPTPYPQQPGQYQQAAYPGRPLVPKNHLTAVLLSIFLGGIGVDRFYLGHIGLGIAKLCLNWLTGGIWAIVDLVLIATKNVKGVIWE